MAENPVDPRVANRDLWDGWTDLHVSSDFYDVDGFVADPGARPLDSVVREVVGDVSGKRLLHLQCHFGMDTLRFALMGAQVTGVDFSARAVAEARTLAERLSLPATFVEADVTDLPAEVAPEGFDVVFTSHGVLSWLPDLAPWAKSIASRLAPGGAFHVVDMHPALWVFDDERDMPSLEVRYSYFDRSPLRFEEHGSYAVPDADFHAESYSFQHTFEEILGALIGEGLVIESLREYPKLAWQYVPFMVQDCEGFWTLPAEMPEIPMMFALTARKPS